MAKLLSAVHSDSSSLSSSSSASANTHTQRPQSATLSRRKRHPSSRKVPVTSPSPAALAALATISAATVSAVYGHPLDEHPPPPDFLCPSLSTDCVTESLFAPSTSTSVSVLHPPSPRRDVATPVPDSKEKRDSRPFVPAKYEQGTDGRWRKSSSWSLYGSSFCAVSSFLPLRLFWYFLGYNLHLNID